MEGSAIEWTDHTFNPWIGCQHAGPGCLHCYAETRDARFVPKDDPARGTAPHWGPHAARKRTVPGNWRQPLFWERDAPAFLLKHGRRQRVFCASLADVFDNHQSIDPQWRLDLGRLIESTPSLDWLLLTKRIGNALDMLIEMFPHGVPGNVRVGATIVNQEEWDRDHRKIAQVMVATTRKPFLSMEPLLGRIDLARTDPAWHRYIGWVITGGESGKDARMVDPWAVYSLQGQCQQRQVPYLHKQWGEWAPIAAADCKEGDVIVRLDDNFVTTGVTMRRVGKKNAGRELRGVTYSEFPA